MEVSHDKRNCKRKGSPQKKGYDPPNDQWKCAKGGAGVDIRYISPSDNRGAGTWVSHQLDKYTDGTMVRFIVK